MRAQEFIIEAREADLYHGTSIDQAEDILSNNIFPTEATVDIRATKFMKPEKSPVDTVSFSRSLPAASLFALYDNRSIFRGVIFVIDQGLLYRDIGRRIASYDDLYYDDSYRGITKTSEFEEAVFGPVKNANKYIKEIIVFVPSAKIDQVSEWTEQYPRVLGDSRTKIYPAPVDRKALSGRRELDKTVNKTQP